MNEIWKYSSLLVSAAITASVVAILLGAPIQVITSLIHLR